MIHFSKFLVAICVVRCMSTNITVCRNVSLHALTQVHSCWCGLLLSYSYRLCRCGEFVSMIACSCLVH